MLLYSKEKFFENFLSKLIIISSFNRLDFTKLEKIVNSLKLSIPPKDLTQTDSKFLINSIFSKWLPLSDSALAMV